MVQMDIRNPFRPKEKGGLGVVDIQVQASALYFRWLHPLLIHDQTTIDAHPVSYLLSYHIRNVTGYPYHQIPLLFPVTRRNKGLKWQRTGTVDMLYRAVDYLPKSFNHAQINPATTMILPLQVAFYVAPSSTLVLPLRVKEMVVSDVFQYDARLNFVHWKDTRDPSLLPLKRTPGIVFRALAPGVLKFQPYFVPVCSPAPLRDAEVSFSPLVNQLRLQDGQSFGNVQASAKIFRSAVTKSSVQPRALRNVTTAHWKFFWSLSLTYVQRNVIYRFINGCIPNRRCLHYMMPQVFESPDCLVCLSSLDSTSHLLFDCPTKERIWQGVIFEFLWPTTTIQDIKEALLSLDFSNLWYCQVKGIRPYRILLITLAHIWLAHMRLVFDKVVIVPESVLVTIRSAIRQTVEEDLVHDNL